MKSHTKKILIWLIIVVSIMACVPSIATPVPTLDAIAINTFIAQTANAASMQTAAAMPVLVSTATFTTTPRSTFTPESTFTPVGVIVFPSPIVVSKIQYFRVKHDTQLEMYNYKSRTADKNWGYTNQTTEMARLYKSPSLKSETIRTNLDNSWETYINALNNQNAKKLRYLKANNTALFNHSGFPLLESLTMGGNIIVLDAIQGTWGRVHTLSLTSPGSLKDVNYITRPDLIHKFVVVGWNQSTKSTFWNNPPPGDIYWPLVSSRAVWIPMEYLEPFPILPMAVTANTMQAIRTEPSLSSSLTGLELHEGDSVSVVEYHPSASDVWGRLSSGGWIALLSHEKGPASYPTSWSMATMPPIPPSE